MFRVSLAWQHKEKYIPKCISFKWLFNEPEEIKAFKASSWSFNKRTYGSKRVPSLQDVRGTSSCWESLKSQPAPQLHCKQGASWECHGGKYIRLIDGNNLMVKPIRDFWRLKLKKKKPLKKLQSFMHTWNVEDYCTLFLQVFFLSKIPQEMYMVLEKHSVNLHKKNKRERKKIPTNTKKSSQVWSCNYEKLFPSVCQLHSLSLLFGKFRVWLWLVGVFSNFLWCD